MRRTLIFLPILTTPSAPTLERDHFLMAQPPLLYQEGKWKTVWMCT